LILQWQNKANYFKLPILVAPRLIYSLLKIVAGLFFIGFLFFRCDISIAQDFAYKHYTINDGLAGNHVYQSLQDHEGYIWFATETGVSRFDGKDFVNFTVADGLPCNEILNLFLDSKGRLWMMPFSNKLCYYFKGKIYNSDNDSTLKLFKIKDFIICIKEDLNHNLYFIEQKNNLFLLKANNKMIQFSDHLDYYQIGIGKDNVFQLIAARNSGRIVADRCGIYNINFDDKNISLTPSVKQLNFFGDKPSQIYISKDLLITPNNKEYLHLTKLINFIRNNHTTIVEIPKVLNSIYIINDSLCNINSAFGSTQINYKTGQRICDFLKNESVTSSIIDNEKNLWFTTELNGIYRLYSKGIINWSNKGQLNTKNLIRSVGGIDNKILFGNSIGDYYYIERNQRKLWTKKLFNVNGIVGMNQKIKSANNKLYIFDRMKFYIMDFKNKITRNEMSDNYFMTIKDFEVMPNEDIYIAFHNGLCFLSHHELNNANKKKKLNIFYNSRTTSLAKVDSGCYFGTINGLNFFNWDNKITDIAARFPELKVNVSNLFFNDGLLWVGTTDRGLICFDGKKVLKIITIKNGLPENSIRCIYANHDYLWVGTNKGLAEIDLKTSDFKVVKTVSNFKGLVSNIINDVYCYKDTLYAATNEGISIIDLKNLDYFSQCVLTDPQIKISGENIKDKKNNLLLKPGQSIGFEFNAISFKSEGGINYYYRLAGLDSNWKIYNRNVIEFLYLPNGSYQFELFAVNRFGAKSKTISIPFAVEKIYYQKTGFIFCMILLLGVLVGLLVYFIVSKQKKSMNQKIFISQKLNKLEQDALKAQMNPHFIFNCLNAVQYFVLEKDILRANQFITSFSLIIRHSLDHLSLNQISIKDEIVFLESYLHLEQMRFEDKFVFEIIVGENLDIENTFVPPMLIQPLIENSINHGILNKQIGMGFIRIEINIHEGMLICNVTDNGIGREKSAMFVSKGHQSKALNLIEKRILLLNKSNPNLIGFRIEDLLDNENKVSGTLVILSVLCDN
jgi:hypothetical protein